MGYIYSNYAGLRVPDEDAADDVPADLSYLVDQLDTTTVLRATSLGDRDSKFYDAPSGVICVVRNPSDATTDPGKVFGVYVKTSNPGTVAWSQIWEPPASVNFLTLSLADAITTRGTPTYDPGVWKENELFAQLKGAVVRTDGQQITQGTTLGYLPSSLLPMQEAADFPCSTAYHSSATGSSTKVAMWNDGRLAYYGASVNWVGLDGIRYFLAQS